MTGEAAGRDGKVTPGIHGLACYDTARAMARTAGSTRQDGFCRQRSGGGGGSRQAPDTDRIAHSQSSGGSGSYGGALGSNQTGRDIGGYKALHGTGRE